MTTRLDTLLHETGILSRRSSRLEQSGRETPTAAAAEATGEAEAGMAAVAAREMVGGGERRRRR